MPSRKAVILLSGGLDSAVTLAYARSQGYACYALTADYGQRHRIEIDRSRQLAADLGVAAHKIVQVDLRAFGGSALTSDLAVPTSPTEGIPDTYVPARNTVLLSLGLAWAETLKASAIFIGANHVDYSGYPDCRPDFLKAFEKLAHLGTKAGVEGKWPLTIQAPLLEKTKAQIIQLGRQLGVHFEWTTSCYSPGPQGRPCGACDSCRIREKGFQEAGIPDPAR